MSIEFLRGNSQSPRGHAILVARSATDPSVVFWTYCIIPPLPFSMSKYFPAFLASQLSPEELRESTNVSIFPIPPMLEEGGSFEHLQMLAERRDDDFCDIGLVNPRDEMARMQQAMEKCQEYGTLYMNYAATFGRASQPREIEAEEPLALDDMDAEELLMETMTERQRLADKYKSSELLAAAFDTSERGAKLAQLYLERSFKLLDEEYAEIPGIERAIRELRD